MSHWFHHDPAHGRTGPFSTEGLVERYRQRLIQADTLVWREGLPEWVTLERAMAALDTPLGQQPPPLPSFPPDVPAYAPATASGPGYRHPAGMHSAARQKKSMSGCLIALIVAAVVAVPMIAILAAIALPAYRDYTVKAKVMQAIVQSQPVQDAIAAHVGRTGACPASGDTGFEDPRRFATPLVQSVQLGVRDDGACVYGLTLPFAGEDGVPARAVMAMRAAGDGYAFELDCQASRLAIRYQPGLCRNTSEDVQ